MRNWIYFSAMVGIAFMVARFIGVFFDLAYNDLFLTLALVLLLGITLPLSILENIRYQRKRKEILEKYKQRRNNAVKQFGSEYPKSSLDSKDSKGKNSHEYPSFSKRKQGLKWGGGNVHASAAKRGQRRRFMKH